MKCPHCAKDSRALVLESRAHDENLYRRRQCGACGRTFVTEEVAHAEMRLPRPSGPARAKAKHGIQPMGVISGSGLHLHEVWR